jgi:pyrroline-5-carboxylate reductase
MSAFAGKKVAFIGGGMMGSAMIGGVLRQGILQPTQITVADPDGERGEQLVTAHGVRYTPSNIEAVRGADIVVMAVKPQYFDSVVADIAGDVAEADFVLSIMAGVTISHVCRRLHVERMVRSMPNTPAAIGHGITAWLSTNAVSEAGQAMAEQLLQSLGETVRVPNESYLDMATAVSGSGPAYVFLFMEAMIDAAVHMGFSRADAAKLVTHTVSGAAEYARQSGEHPAVLRNQVTSPGGTTAEGLYHMEQQGLRAAVARGIWAAYQRSVMLGGGHPRNPDTSV